MQQINDKGATYADIVITIAVLQAPVMPSKKQHFGVHSFVKFYITNLLLAVCI